MHSANHFKIHLRNLTAPTDAIAERLSFIQQQGVPNYFGEQRFGIEGQNLPAAKTWFEENTASNAALRASI